ncbi:glutamine amidotransferase class-I family protein [Mycobacterium xenopi 4042]|uniref:GMP synthase (glutamine-hydrolyzing) n=1 Tax=Mycobacterium xenopi 4042 TaxID=1299334 RepID=X7YJJ2_MYCXE|nr:glutamine amidotransferase class-I family protein [Mycobacterium xenopi 4042]
MFGICYGFQAMAQTLGGTVARTGTSEYGRTELTVTGGDLHADLPATQPVWMSHGDAVTAAPQGFAVVATSAGSPVAAFEDRPAAGGRAIPPRGDAQPARATGTEPVSARVRRHRRGMDARQHCRHAHRTGAGQIGQGHAICGLSGGVDSAVAAALVQRAIGEKLTCVFVDHGLLRAGERAQVQRDFVAATGANLVTVDAAATFLEALTGVTNPEGKRKIIGRQFIRAFEGAVRDLMSRDTEVEFLVQGTLYPDVVESGGGAGAANIKSHHNVGGLPGDLKFKLVEPLRLLFKDEVRAVGRELGLPEEIVARQPFPGPGLAVRIVGEVTAARLDVLRRADAIAREELTAAGWTARSGSARWCCWPTSARSGCRATTAPTGTRSCCARCQAKTP